MSCGLLLAFLGLCVAYIWTESPAMFILLLPGPNLRKMWGLSDVVSPASCSPHSLMTPNNALLRDWSRAWYWIYKLRLYDLLTKYKVVMTRKGCIVFSYSEWIVEGSDIRKITWFFLNLDHRKQGCGSDESRADFHNWTYDQCRLVKSFLRIIVLKCCGLDVLHICCCLNKISSGVFLKNVVSASRGMEG